MADVPLDLGQRILQITQMAVAMHLHQKGAMIGDRRNLVSRDGVSQQHAQRVVIGRADPQLAGGSGSGESVTTPGDPTTDGRLREA